MTAGDAAEATSASIDAPHTPPTGAIGGPSAAPGMVHDAPGVAQDASGEALRELPAFDASNTSLHYRLLFHHTSRLVAHGHRRRLEERDVYSEPALEPAELWPAFSAAWEAELRRSHASGGAAKPSLWRAVGRGSARPLLITAAMHFVGVACTFAQPLILEQIVRGLACKGKACDPPQTLYKWAGVLAGTAVVSNVLASHERIMLSLLGVRIRNQLMASVYRKTLRLSSGALQTESSGRIVTLMSNDAQKIQEFIVLVHEVWAAPLIVGAALWLLFQVLTWATFIGLAVIMCLVPLTSTTAKRLFGLRRGLLGLADKRVGLLSEVVGGIRVIKLACWEKRFEEKVSAVRALEVGTLWRISKLSAVFGVLIFAAPVLISVAAIGTYSLYDGSLTATRLYTALSCFNIIRFPLAFLPFIMLSLLNSKVAIDRLGEFLVADEAEELVPDTATAPGAIVVSGPAAFSYAQPTAKPAPEAAGGKRGGAKPGASGAPAAELKSASASVLLDAPSAPFRLTGVELRVAPGQLVMVIGPVGSGKSSLLYALNRYLVRDHGSVALGGSLAYAAQSAWILNATVEANVLFGMPMDAARYAAALDAAQLRPDLLALPYGDQTEIGEKGVTLSGGQKQRVSLARLVYADADVNLLDDPLSAVDAHVGAALFEQCICGVLGRKTRVLVTHALTYLPHADQIVVVEDGRMREAGTYAELRAKGTDFDTMCKAHAVHDGEAAASPKTAASSAKAATPEDAPAKKPYIADAKNLTGEEQRTAGNVSSSVYAAYANAAGSRGVLLLVVVAFSVEYGSKAFCDSWLTFWTSDTFHWSADPQKRNYYLLIYFCLFVGNACCTFVERLSVFYFARRASQNLHDRMLRKVLRMPQTFFDTTPSGRIINRFSRDTEVLDNLLPASLSQFLACFFSILTSFIVISVVNPWFVLVLVPILFLYLKLQRYYIPACVELQRIESTTRSPIYASLGEAVAGIPTIRAYGRGSHFIDASDSVVFRNGCTVQTQRMSAEWLNIRLRFLSAVVSTLAAVLVIAGRVPPGLAGLTLVYAFQVPQFMERGTAQASDAESKMNSVERMGEYDRMPEEAPHELPTDAALPPSWPASGALTVENLVVRYRPELPPVLRSVSFALETSQKLGIVGRTGSGKSSLVLALLRIVEPQTGRVLLDGVDVAHIGLARLRNAFAVIPQDPFVFAGSLRANLDPFAEHGDDALWAALDRVGLKTMVQADVKKLELPVLDAGANFSLGQRQLLCMARALLRDARCLVLDEATASVDYDTDTLIQKTVREAFKHVTVLTIAHRLISVMDSDRVLVLDGGEVAEFGAPSQLLQRPAGAFSALVNQTGPQNAAHLKSLALGQTGGAKRG